MKERSKEEEIREASPKDMVHGDSKGKKGVFTLPLAVESQ